MQQKKEKGKAFIQNFTFIYQSWNVDGKTPKSPSSGHLYSLKLLRFIKHNHIRLTFILISPMAKAVQSWYLEGSDT